MDDKAKTVAQTVLNLRQWAMDTMASNVGDEKTMEQAGYVFQEFTKVIFWAQDVARG